MCCLCCDIYKWLDLILVFSDKDILGDPGADSGGEGKSKRAEKCGTKKSKPTVWNWSGKTLSPGALLAVLFFSSCLIFPPVLTFPCPHYLPLGLRGCPQSWIQDFGRFQDFRFPKSWFQDSGRFQEFSFPKSWIQDFGRFHDFSFPKSWPLDSGRFLRF